MQINPNKLQVSPTLTISIFSSYPYRPPLSLLQNGGGSGFGLFITKGIVKLHDASIWAESEGEDKGEMKTHLILILRHPPTYPPTKQTTPTPLKNPYPLETSRASTPSNAFFYRCSLPPPHSPDTTFFVKLPPSAPNSSYYQLTSFHLLYYR